MTLFKMTNIIFFQELYTVSKMASTIKRRKCTHAQINI